MVTDLVPIMGFCCSFTSLYCPEKCSQMCGCFGQVTCLCLEEEFFCCKPSEKDTDCCILQKISVVIIKPTTCISGKAQVFCLDNRCALPCNEDIPCIMNACGLNCCIDWGMSFGCCKKVIDLRPQTA